MKKANPFQKSSSAPPFFNYYYYFSELTHLPQDSNLATILHFMASLCLNALMIIMQSAQYQMS